VTFNIQINLSPQAPEKPAAIPTVNEADARAIEDVDPSTRA